jgi:AcrR family transcriptional regulator
VSSYHPLPRPQRKDAVRNRAALIQAAREVFALRGFEASMDDIAEHARLGVGTAYRHFPNKYVLADAVLDDVVGDFVARARQSLSETDPWDALVRLIERALEAQTDNRAIREIMLGQRQDSPEHHRAMIDAFAEPFARARLAGAVRADADVTDLSAIVIMLCTVAEASGGRSPHLWRRYLPILLQGMRPGGAALPVPPLVEGDLAVAPMSA